MSYKVLTITLFIILLFSWSLFVFWQRADIFSFWERESFEKEPEEFNQLYVLEVPPQSKYLAGGSSEKIFGAIESESDIIIQDQEKALPGLLQLFDVQYVLLRDEKYWEIFEPFLDYSSEKEKEDLPRTFPVEKEALAASSEPFLILGRGWSGQWEDDYGVAQRWLGREASIHYIVSPETFDRTPDFLAFSVPWSILPEKGKKAEIEVIVNGKPVYSSDLYSWNVVKLSNLQEGINEIKLRSSKGCVVPDGPDDRCLSFIIKNVELFSPQDIPSGGLLRLDRFLEIEEGQYWTEKHATLRLFTFSETPSLITFQMRQVNDKPGMISIIEKDKEIDRVILFGQEPQKISLLTYRKGENIFYFVSDDCEEKIIEEQEICVVAQIKDIEIELVE